MEMLVTYDSSADAVYIYVQHGAQVARSVLIDDSRVVDLDDDGRVVGIEVLSPSPAFKLEDIIDRFHLEPIKEQLLTAAREFRPAATA